MAAVYSQDWLLPPASWTDRHGQDNIWSPTHISWRRICRRGFAQPGVDRQGADSAVHGARNYVSTCRYSYVQNPAAANGHLSIFAISCFLSAFQHIRRFDYLAFVGVSGVCAGWPRRATTGHLVSARDDNGGWNFLLLGRISNILDMDFKMPFL
jgi:hypothetical protein